MFSSYNKRIIHTFGQNLLAVFTLCLILTTTTGCGPSKKKHSLQSANTEGMVIPRADPGYLQYLEKQSMLSQAANMARVVSGSELAWKASASAGTPDAMLNYADTWIHIHPFTLLVEGGRPAFSFLSESRSWTILREAGVNGLYIAPMFGGGALWAYGQSELTTGEDIVQYSFSEQAGSEKLYRHFMQTVIDHDALVGSDLIPAAAGLGPDFFLATRNHREYPGIFYMVELPQKMWTQLPNVESEWQGVALEQHQIDSLTAEGLLSKSVRDQTPALDYALGWAVTGDVRGLDGATRRWAYRYFQNPKQAILNWEDPSQAAHRILSGSAVRQVGLLGQALIGLQFKAFQGLEAAPANISVQDSFNIEPALTAAQSMSREIHRYGGWTWLRDDDLTLPAIKAVHQAGVDYTYDSAFSPASEHALLSGDASLLRFMADEVIKAQLDTRKLMHTMPTEAGINYTLPHLRYLIATENDPQATQLLESVISTVQNTAQKQTTATFKNNTLFTTSAGLLIMGLGVDGAAVEEKHIPSIINGHSLLIQFKALQPGGLVLTGQDFVGALPLSYTALAASKDQWDPSYSNRGSYGLTGMANSLVVTKHGLPKTSLLYPDADVQAHKPNSFLNRIGAITKLRKQTGVFKGKLIARPETKFPGTIALLTELPDGKSYVLSICNFSRTSVNETISFNLNNDIRSALQRIAPLIGNYEDLRVAGATASIHLAPWQGKAFLLGKSSSQISKIASTPQLNQYGKATQNSEHQLPPTELAENSSDGKSKQNPIEATTAESDISNKPSGQSLASSLDVKQADTLAKSKKTTSDIRDNTVQTPLAVKLPDDQAHPEKTNPTTKQDLQIKNSSQDQPKSSTRLDKETNTKPTERSSEQLQPPLASQPTSGATKTTRSLPKLNKTQLKKTEQPTEPVDRRQMKTSSVEIR